MKTFIDWKAFLILWIASIFAVIAMLPYSLALQNNLLQNLDLSVPLPLIITIQVLQSVVIFVIAILGGLFFTGRVGLGTPILESVARGESETDRVRAILPLSTILEDWNDWYICRIERVSCLIFRR